MERRQSGCKASSDCQLVNANADTPAGRSAWPRGPGPVGVLRVGDFTGSEVMKYLTAGRKFTQNLSSEIVAFYDTRIQLLKVTSDGIDTGIGLKGLSTPLVVACVLF